MFQNKQVKVEAKFDMEKWGEGYLKPLQSLQKPCKSTSTKAWMDLPVEKGPLHQWLERENEMACVRTADNSYMDDVYGNWENWDKRAAKFWNMDDEKMGWKKTIISQVERGVMSNQWEKYLIAFGYSAPSHWPENIQNAFRVWMRLYSNRLMFDDADDGKRSVYRSPSVGGKKFYMDRSFLQSDLVTLIDGKLNHDEAWWLANRILTALEEGTMLNPDVPLKNEWIFNIEEQDMSKKLYEVFIVNINDNDDMSIYQVVADSEDKAKMKAWAETVVEGKNVDDYDFFTVQIGLVREGCCKGDTCKA